MAKDPQVWTTILTSYRAVAHLVVSVLALLLILRECFNGYRKIDGLFILYTSLYGVPECIKGLLLLYSILKEKTITLKIYLVVSCIMLLIVKGLLIWYAVIMSAYHMNVGVFVLFFVIYFTFEWFILYHVCRLHKNLVNSVNGDCLRSEQVQVPLYQPEIVPKYQ